MSSLEKDVEQLERALQTFSQSVKRPQRWAAITAHAGVAIDRPSAVVLHVLLSHEPRQLRVQDLAHQLGIESPSVTRTTQALERNGYLERVPDPKDRRAVTLHVTAAGRKLAKRLWTLQRADISTVLADWPQAERHQFITQFERFSRELDRVASKDITPISRRKDT